jgi:hypothetical protein
MGDFIENSKSKPAAAPQPTERDRRRADSLRANLRRRKVQARDRAEANRNDGPSERDESPGDA